MNVFLDDERIPGQVTWVVMPQVTWTIVRNLDEFKDLIDHHLHVVQFISFDHDLGQKHYPPRCDYSDGLTGFDCAKYLCEVCMDKNIPLPEYQVHSMNPVGKENIISYLENFKRVQSQRN